MADPLEDVLRLVAEGRLSPEEAAPIIDALASRRGPRADSAAPNVRPGAAGSPAGSGPWGAGRGPLPRIRVEVRDRGRTVVDVQVPAFLSELAQALPGIPAAYAAQVRSAIRDGVRGRIVDLRDEDGSGIAITVD